MGFSEDIRGVEFRRMSIRDTPLKPLKPLKKSILYVCSISNTHLVAISKHRAQRGAWRCSMFFAILRWARHAAALLRTTKPLEPLTFACHPSRPPSNFRSTRCPTRPSMRLHVVLRPSPTGIRGYDVKRIIRRCLTRTH